VLAYWWVAFIAATVASVVVPVRFGRTRTLRINVDLAQLEYLRDLLNKYREVHGRFPMADEGLEALRRADANMTVLLRKSVPLDSWGEPYVYSVVPDGSAFQLYSTGRNRIDEHGGGDDVTDRRKKYKCDDYDVNCGIRIRNKADAAMLIALLVAVASLTIGVARGILRLVQSWHHA